MAKRKQVSFKTLDGRITFDKRKVKQKPAKVEKKERNVDNSLLKKYCPFFRQKCKGLNCAFGYEKTGSCLSFEREQTTLTCKLFEGLTGKIKFEIETSLKQEEE